MSRDCGDARERKPKQLPEESWIITAGSCSRRSLRPAVPNTSYQAILTIGKLDSFQSCLPTIDTHTLVLRQNWPVPAKWGDFYRFSAKFQSCLPIVDTYLLQWGRIGQSTPNRRPFGRLLDSPRPIGGVLPVIGQSTPNRRTFYRF